MKSKILFELTFAVPQNRKLNINAKVLEKNFKTENE